MNPFNPDKKQPSKQPSKQSSKQPKKKKTSTSGSGTSSSTSDLLTTGASRDRKPKSSTPSETESKKVNSLTTLKLPDAFSFEELRDLVMAEGLSEKIERLTCSMGFQGDTLDLEATKPKPVDLKTDSGKGRYQTLEPTISEPVDLKSDLGGSEPVELPSDSVESMPRALSPTLPKLVSQFKAQNLTDRSETSTKKIDVLTSKDSVSESKLKRSSSYDIFKPLESFVEWSTKNLSNFESKPDTKTAKVKLTTKNTRGVLINVSDDTRECSKKILSKPELKPDRKTINVKSLPTTAENTRDLLMDVPDNLRDCSRRDSSNSESTTDRKTTNAKSVPSTTKHTRGRLLDVSDDMRERYKPLGAIPKVFATPKTKISKESSQKKSKTDASDGKASHLKLGGSKLSKTDRQGVPPSSLPSKDSGKPSPKRSERTQLSWRESKDGQPLKTARFPRAETTKPPFQSTKVRDYKNIPKCIVRDRKAVMPKQIPLFFMTKNLQDEAKNTKGPEKEKKNVSFDLPVKKDDESPVKSNQRAKEMLDFPSDKIISQDVSVNQSGGTSSPENNSDAFKESLSSTVSSSSVSKDMDSDLGDFNHDLGEAILDSIFFGHADDDEEYDTFEEYKGDSVEALKTKHRTIVPSKYRTRTRSRTKDKPKKKPEDKARHKGTLKAPSQLDASHPMHHRIRFPGQGGGADSPDLEFIYDDTDTHGNEIAELYSYTEQPELQLNVKAFEDQMEYYDLPPSWQCLPVEKRKSVIMKLLDQLEVSKKPLRMRSARCLLYIAQGCWAEMQSDTEQQHWARINCMLLYQLGTFTSFTELLNIEIENCSAAHTALRKIAVSLADSLDLRVILSVLYTITEVIRNERATENSEFQSDIDAFCFDIGNESGDELLVIKLLGMVTRFCSGASPHFPMKKVLLLLWKLILVSLGGMDTLKDSKAQKRQRADLIPLDEDTMEIAKTMRSSSPPASASDLLEAQNQKRNTRPFRRSLMKQSSLDDQESLGMEMETTMGNDNGDDLADMTEYDERRPSDNSEASQMYNTHNINMYNRQMSPPPQHDVIPRGLPWKPKVRQKDIDLFLDQSRLKFLGYSLSGDQETLFGLPEPIHEGVRILKAHVYTSLAELQVLKEEEMARNPLSTEEDEVDLNQAEMLYQAMLPNLPQYMIALLKILLAAAPTSKAKTDSINIMADVLPEEMPMTVLQSMKLGIDVNRHKEIIVKAVSAVLLLLLKHFKLNHVYQFEFMSQHLVFANCIPLVLKFFNQNIMAYVGAKNVIPILDFPSCVIGDQPELTAESLEIGDAASFSWRNMFSCINLLRILNKLTKWKHSRIMMLVVFKSAPILKRTLKVRHAMTQLYVLKLLKMQTKYLGRQWRKSNMKTISAIYQKVRHRLNDDWAYGNDLDARPWDFQAEECALRASVDRFNNRRYTLIMENDFEPVDNNVSSVLGQAPELSDSFKEHYFLWLEQEVFGTPVDWDRLILHRDRDEDGADDDNNE